MEKSEIRTLEAVNRLPEVAEDHSDEDEVEVVQKKVKRVHSILYTILLSKDKGSHRFDTEFYKQKNHKMLTRLPGRGLKKSYFFGFFLLPFSEEKNKVL